MTSPSPETLEREMTMPTRPKPQLTELDMHLIKAAIATEGLLKVLPVDHRGGSNLISRMDILKRNRRELREHPGDKVLQTQMTKNIRVNLEYVRTR